MKIVLLFFTFAFLLFTLPQPVSAHLIGQPPFLKINNQYANLYPVPLSSLYDFDLPQDLAPDNYSLNQSINFELDQNRLPAPPDIVTKTKFDWDFTDGTHGQGLKLAHTFTKVGSYVVKIFADDGSTPKPQLLESVLINILPTNGYQLPKAKILVNGKGSIDPLTDILQADFNNSIKLDGSQSTASIEYFWDFGDQKSASGSKQTHQYPKDLSQVFVVLRIKDSNGFLADNFVEVQNSQNAQNDISSASAKPKPQAKKEDRFIFWVSISIAVIFLLLIAYKLYQGRSGQFGRKS